MQGLVNVDLTPILVRASGTEPCVKVAVEGELFKSSKGNNEEGSGSR
jgi:phosphomannomutase